MPGTVDVCIESRVTKTHAAHNTALHSSTRLEDAPYAMSSAATTSKAEDATKSTEPPKEGDQTLPHLSVLEEDDEFEEFAVQGEPPTFSQTPAPATAFTPHTNLSPLPPSVDWDDSQTDLAHLGGVAPGAAKSEGDKLWEDNWDDDDIEEEFSVQLR